MQLQLSGQDCTAVYFDSLDSVLALEFFSSELLLCVKMTLKVTTAWVFDVCCWHSTILATKKLPWGPSKVKNVSWQSSALRRVCSYATKRLHPTMIKITCCCFFPKCHPVVTINITWSFISKNWACFLQISLSASSFISSLLNLSYSKIRNFHSIIMRTIIIMTIIIM